MTEKVIHTYIHKFKACNTVKLESEAYNLVYDCHLFTDFLEIVISSAETQTVKSLILILYHIANYKH